VSGKFVKYKQVENVLYLADNFSAVNILYKGVLVDEEGLPQLNEKELDAVSTFCAWRHLLKKGIVTKDGGTIQIAQMLEAQWKLTCTQARVPDYINQNEMDEILNAGTSWDRKRYGRSFKPIK